MLGLGLSLTLADFARVVKYPKPVLIGLVCRFLILPLACFFIAKGFALAPLWRRADAAGGFAGWHQCQSLQPPAHATWR